MTPKEKAEYLVNQYKMILMHEDTNCGDEILCSLIAMKHVEIVIAEIISFMDEFKLYIQMKDQYEWWQQVKIEIASL